MKNTEERIEELLETHYWLIDIFPKRISRENADAYFRARDYFEQEEKRIGIFGRFLGFLWKLDCYCPFETVRVKDETVCVLDPDELEKCFTDHEPAAGFCFLFKDRESMIRFSQDDLYMTLYQPDEELLEKCALLAQSEGLFVWEDKEEE